jgi:hypothetical protein
MFGSISRNLSFSGPQQIYAVFDAWTLGRYDAQYLLIVRRQLLDLQGDALTRSIWLLSHAGSNPDIFYIPGKNWIPPET